MDDEKDLKPNPESAGPPPQPNDAPAPHQASSGVLEYARRLLLGSVSLTLDEINEFLAWLKRRGSVSEADVALLVQQYVETHPADGAAPDDLVVVNLPPRLEKQSALERSVETILVRLNVPTRSDIENLSRKITMLNEKVSRLKEMREANAAPPALPDDGAAPPGQRADAAGGRPFNGARGNQAC